MKIQFLLVVFSSFCQGDYVPWQVSFLPQLTSQRRSLARNWPCPSASSIIPCVCNVDESGDLYLDCSAVQNEEELRNALSDCAQKFPFMAFKILYIIHTGSEDLTSISSEVFCLLTFENVIITGTKISSIDENVFYLSEPSLKVLELDDNLIDTFFFESLILYTILEKLSLAYNNLTYIPSLSSNSLLTFIANGNMQLGFGADTFTGVPTIKEIYLNDVNLTSVQVGTFNLPNLEILSLLRNQIKILEPGIIASTGDSISSVVLSLNNITLIEEGFITGLSLYASIELISNEILSIDENVWTPIFQDMNYTGRIDFTDNPISCGCEIEWLVDSPEAIAMITSISTCYGGTESITELPPDAFDYHCR